MTQSPNETFLKEVDQLLEDAPNSPTEIQRDGKPSAYLLPEALYDDLLAKAQAYEALMVETAQANQNEVDAMAALQAATKKN